MNLGELCRMDRPVHSNVGQQVLPANAETVHTASRSDVKGDDYVVAGASIRSSEITLWWLLVVVFGVFSCFFPLSLVRLFCLFSVCLSVSLSPCGCVGCSGFRPSPFLISFPVLARSLGNFSHARGACRRQGGAAGHTPTHPSTRQCIRRVVLSSS